MVRYFVALAMLASVSLTVWATDGNTPALRAEKSIDLRGDIVHGEELSGLALWGNLLVACPDEGAEFNVLRPVKDDAYKLLTTVNLLDGEDEEIDMEGATSDGKHVYIVGSHSIRRKAVSEKGDQEKNHKRLAKVAPHEASYSLFRLTLDGEGRMISRDQVSLLPILQSNEILKRYVTIPSKENGIDIEGVAVKEGRLYVGFRGPVLGGNFVPVLSFEFDRPSEYDLKFVQLNGRGIRDIVATEKGFLILAGPVGEGDASYQLYLWNGEDCVPGEGKASGTAVAVGEFATSKETKPEGLAILGETPDEWQLLVLSDGADRATRWRALKP